MFALKQKEDRPGNWIKTHAECHSMVDELKEMYNVAIAQGKLLEQSLGTA